MKKVVVKLNSLDDKIFFLVDGMIKKNPMQAASSIKGIVSMELNNKDNKITIVGDVDPIKVVKKLQKWYPKIDTVGPAKEEKKPKKPAVVDKEEVPIEQEQMAMFLHQAYRNYAQPYYVHNCDENPNACVIC